MNKTLQLKTEKPPIRQVVLALTDFLWQHLQVGHPAVFEELNSVHAIKAIIFDHIEGAVHGQSLQDGAFPRGHAAFLPPGVLNPPTQKVVGVRGQAQRWALTQLSKATLPTGRESTFTLASVQLISNFIQMAGIPTTIYKHLTDYLNNKTIWKKSGGFFNMT